MAELTAWLADFYLLATVLLLVEAVAASVAGRPARRMALARAALFGLAVLAVLLALPGRARLGLGLVDDPVASAAQMVVPHWLVGSFLAGSVLVGVWLWMGARRVRELARRSRPAPVHLQELMRRVVGTEQRLPALRLAGEVRQPVALGAWRPILLLPARLEKSTPADQVEAVLAHEWAHVTHGDLRLLALSRLLLLLLFAHPLYLILRRRMRADQEMQADAAAAARAGAVDYAATLVDWARQGALSGGRKPPEQAAGLVSGGSRPLRKVRFSPLRRRIAALLHPDFRADDRWAPRWHFAAAVLTVVAVIVLSPVTLRQVQTPRAEATPAIAHASVVSPAAAPAPVPTVEARIEIVVRVPVPVVQSEAERPAATADVDWFNADTFVRWCKKVGVQWTFRVLAWKYQERVHRD